jgi:hypothetical protein
MKQSIIVSALLCLILASGCEKDSKMEDAMENAADKTGDAIDNAGDAVEDAAEEADNPK